jgi:hypothetical protein
MAIAAWWSGLSEQRFWMEATDREVLGDDLRAPKLGGTGKPVWHYELVSLVQPGDIIFHWHTTLLGKPSLVGWSTAIGPLHEELHPWTTHAGVNAQDAAVPRPNWIMPLGGLHPFAVPIDNTALASIRGGLLDLRDTLSAQYDDFRYFPFAKYGENEIRAAQAYATKFPRELLDLLCDALGLDFEDQSADVAALELGAHSGSRGGSGGGYMRNTALRLAIEQQAIDRAVEFYESLGATDIITLGKPYDLKIQLSGQEVRIEVKGSTGTVEKVLVTSGEVAHAHSFPRVELLVVDQIGWKADATGEYAAHGGRIRRWQGWKPSTESLTAKTYEHRLSLHPSGVPSSSIGPTSFV